MPPAIRANAAGVRESAAQRRSPALRAMLCIALPLPIGLLTGHPADGAQASFGGLAALYVPEAPYRYQARVVAATGAGLTLAVFLGALVGTLGWLAVVVACGCTTAASFVCQAVELSPPREMTFVMALLAATAVPGGLADASWRATLTAGGSARIS